MGADGAALLLGGDGTCSCPLGWVCSTGVTQTAPLSLIPPAPLGTRPGRFGDAVPRRRWNRHGSWSCR